MPELDANRPFAIISQEFARTFRPDGTMGGQWTISVEARDGTTFSVTVPEEQYDVQTVATLINERLKTIEAINQLPTRPL